VIEPTAARAVEAADRDAAAQLALGVLPTEVLSVTTSRLEGHVPCAQ
jgi:hypothetical protein